MKLWIRNRSVQPGKRATSPRVWLDLGDLGELIKPRGYWQDHGMGLLRTILHRNGLPTDLASTRWIQDWDELEPQLAGHDMLLMNVRSYTYPLARKGAEIFKRLNPNGVVVTGGMHATVAPHEMEAVEDFDHICQGAGEQSIVELVRDPGAFPRVFTGRGAKSMADWPSIDRTLWPQPLYRRAFKGKQSWPLEPRGWGPAPVASTLTSRVCPWRCAFCNESAYIPNMGRRPVEMVIEELNDIDRRHGPIGSVVFHDSMFFQHPSWIREWIDKYPRLARKRWPYWAAARADTVRQWEDMFRQLVLETNLTTISIGLESGSDRMLRVLNKECTEADNQRAIEIINELGDQMEAAGRTPLTLWTNIMLGIPGEQPEDAFKTMRMIKRIRRADPSLSFYAPYPGSALGFQLIAEGKSLMSDDRYHRYPDDEKVKGIDYQFYRELLAGRYDDEVNRGLDARERAHGVDGSVLVSA